MTYQEFKPGKSLQPYVKCYYVYESATPAAFDDIVFPCASMEIIFNLGTGTWQTRPGDEFVTTPSVELWGQVLKPLPVRSIGRNTMLGIRFFPHAVASILADKVNLFNNQVVNYGDVLGNNVRSLHNQLLETRTWTKRMSLVESFLLEQLARAEKRLNKVALVNDLMQELQQETFNTMEMVAARYGISARYMQQLFVQYTGLTPKLYSQINRFQNSLQLIRAGGSSLTSIAYECGYADQSHFIKEFKTFAGITPSSYSIETSPVSLAANQPEHAQHEGTTSMAAAFV